MASRCPYVYGDVVRFAWLSAWRQGEILSLTWDRVDRAGVPRRVGMLISGHRSEGMYRRYGIVSATEMANALDRTEAGVAQRVAIGDNSRTVVV